MKRLKLKRISECVDCTLGVLIDNETGTPIMVTMENPYSMNQKTVSCIPEGVYECSRYNSEKYHNVYEVKNVPGRDHILFHIGNTAKDTNGCILPGTSYGRIAGVPAVLNSSSAMAELNELLGDDDFEIIIE